MARSTAKPRRWQARTSLRDQYTLETPDTMMTSAKAIWPLAAFNAPFASIDETAALAQERLRSARYACIDLVPARARRPSSRRGGRALRPLPARLYRNSSGLTSRRRNRGTFRSALPSWRARPAWRSSDDRTRWTRSRRRAAGALLMAPARERHVPSSASKSTPGRQGSLGGSPRAARVAAAAMVSRRGRDQRGHDSAYDVLRSGDAAQYFDCLSYPGLASIGRRHRRADRNSRGSEPFHPNPRARSLASCSRRL